MTPTLNEPRTENTEVTEPNKDGIIIDDCAEINRLVLDTSDRLLRDAIESVKHLHTSQQMLILTRVIMLIFNGHFRLMACSAEESARRWEGMCKNKT